MDLKLVFGVFVPLFIVILFIVLNAVNIGLSIKKETVESVQFDSLFVEQYQSIYIPIQTITITNDFFLPRKFELPSLIACLNDKEGVKEMVNLYLKYTEGTYSRSSDIPVPILEDYSRQQSIELPANGEKQIKILIQPIHLYYYSGDIGSYKEYDEILIVQLNDDKRYYNCYNLESEKLNYAIHINITNKPPDCSSISDGICPSSCTIDSDIDCCKKLVGYSWTEGIGCYVDICRTNNSCELRTPGSGFTCNINTTYDSYGKYWCVCTNDCNVNIQKLVN